MEIYRNLYRALISEALAGGLVSDAAEFNRAALAQLDEDTRHLVKLGKEDAVIALCDAAEAWLDAQLDGEFPEDSYGYLDEDAEYRRHIWNRHCDLALDRGHIY